MQTKTTVGEEADGTTTGRKITVSTITKRVRLRLLICGLCLGVLLEFPGVARADQFSLAFFVPRELAIQNFIEIDGAEFCTSANVSAQTVGAIARENDLIIWDVIKSIQDEPEFAALIEKDLGHPLSLDDDADRIQLLLLRICDIFVFDVADLAAVSAALEHPKDYTLIPFH